jgi:single-strand DNA-binding protein
MGTYQRVILIGHLGRDAELRYTPGGAAVASFSVATSETWKDKTTNERKEQTEWHRVVLWGKAAEAIAQYLTKGKQVAVEGKLQTRAWEKDGVKRYATDIKADRVVLLGSKDDGGRQRTARADDDHEPGDDAPDDGMGRGAVDDDEPLPF